MKVFRKCFGLLLFMIWACKPVQLSNDLNHRKAQKIYKQAFHNSTNYNLQFSIDSAHAICQYLDEGYTPGKPVSFFIYDIKNKENLFLSIKEYDKVEWKDSSTVRLTRFLGIPKGHTLQDYSSREGISVFLFNVNTKQLTEQPKPNQELK
jgi:hypothetical protein